MGTCLVWGLIFTLSSIIFAVNPSFAGSLPNDASIFSESLTTPLDDLFLAPLTDQPTMSSALDQVASPSLFDMLEEDSDTDPSELLSWDSSEYENENQASSILDPPPLYNDDVILPDSFQPGPVDDCSSATSDQSPLFLSPPAASAAVTLGKPRVRRLDKKNNNNGAELCPLPATKDSSGAAPNYGDFFPDLPGVSRLRFLPEWNTNVEEALKNRNHNSLCSVYFAGRFPWGLCASKDGRDVELMGGQVVNLALFGFLNLYRVWRGIFGKFNFVCVCEWKVVFRSFFLSSFPFLFFFFGFTHIFSSISIPNTSINSIIFNQPTHSPHLTPFLISSNVLLLIP